MNTTFTESLFQEELYQLPGKVVIVLSKPWPDVSPAEKTQLSKILVALKFSIDTVQIITWQSMDAIVSLSPSKIISFGVPLNPGAPLYEATSVAGRSIMQADALDQLDDAKKRTLWLGLKAMFSI